MPTQTLEATRPGRWIPVHSFGYCSLGQHFYDGPGFAWVEDATPALLRHRCCAECAERADEEEER